jgi:undecaprenyl diphosphate synthase
MKPSKKYHVGLIADGNRRWGQIHGKNERQAHQAGFNAVYKELINKALEQYEAHFDELTLYAFSTENWNRSQKEVGNLMKLFTHFTRNWSKNARDRNMSIHHAGRKDRLPSDLVKSLSEVEDITKKENSKLRVNLCLDYGGEDEIGAALKNILTNPATRNKIQGLSNQEIYDQILLPELYVSRRPDLIIRTGGEQRLSGFLTAQSAYSELFFPGIYLPAMKAEDFTHIFDEFLTKRDRRYGGNSKKRN